MAKKNYALWVYNSKLDKVDKEEGMRENYWYLFNAGVYSNLKRAKDMMKFSKLANPQYRYKITSTLLPDGWEYNKYSKTLFSQSNSVENERLAQNQSRPIAVKKLVRILK